MEPRLRHKLFPSIHHLEDHEPGSSPCRVHYGCQLDVLWLAAELREHRMDGSCHTLARASDLLAHVEGRLESSKYRWRLEPRGHFVSLGGFHQLSTSEV